jgi:hypothetical protein
MRHPIMPAVFLVALLGFALPLLGHPELVVPVLAGTLGGAVAWWLGFEQGRQRGRLDEHNVHAREVLEAYAVTVEGLLASAPDDLDDVGQAVRANLQRRYQEARQMLAELPPEGRP